MATPKLPEYTQHPIAISLMPGGMDEKEFDAFCEDVQTRGIIMPITLYQGMVLDGWHRVRAGLRTSTAWKELTYKGTDPAGYIAAVNILRRKLGSLQRALVGVRLHLDHGLTQREVCKKLGISNEVVSMVLKVVQSKNAKMIKRLEHDSDFTRGMLREELEDVGLLRTRVEEPTPLGANSVFALGGSAASSPEPDEDDMDDLLGGKKAPDTVGITPSDDFIDVSVGLGKAASDRAARKPKISAAQMLAEQFKALMGDEKTEFMRLIWPEARKLAPGAIVEAPATPVTPEAAFGSTFDKPKPVRAKKPALATA
jgi:transcriptional regulator with XRE-family HTH domain